ncbi:MAG: YfiR family protein [Flavobacteriales bacterium]|nr:YfiR family protein [Flavobacteriales bacterium]
MKRLVLILLLVLPSLSMEKGALDPKDTHKTVKALFVYQFATLVDWPKEFKQGDFIIGVFGDSPLYDELVSKYSNKSVGKQAIKIKTFPTFSEVSHCHILVVAPDQSDRVSELSKKFKSKSTLIVTEKEGKLREGAVINFVIKDNKQSYELSKSNASKYKLVVGSKLENLAARVE